MARSVLGKTVAGALFVWLLVVLLWMTLLSGNWNAVNCRDGVERLQRTIMNTSYNPSISRRYPHFSSNDDISRSHPPSALAQRLHYYTSLIDAEPQQASENCTLVVQTYNRTQILPKFLSHYCKITKLQKIIVVRNDVNRTLTGSLATWASRCKPNLQFLKSDANKISNRYIPRTEIETSCVLLVDDDQILSIYDIHFGIEVWQNFRHLLVGFQESGFVKDSQDRYLYVPHQKHRYIGIQTRHKRSIHKVEILNGTKILRIGNKTYNLGKASPTPSEGQSQNNAATLEGYSFLKTPCFVHKAYLEMYFDSLMVPAGAVEYVDSLWNCEDLLLSIMITKFLYDSKRPQCGVLAVKSSLAIKNLEEEAVSKGGNRDLSKRPGYLDERSNCLNKFSEMYGHLPLQLSNTIATLI